MDSPRGRIYLMKGVLDERSKPTRRSSPPRTSALDCAPARRRAPRASSTATSSKDPDDLRATRSRGLIVMFLSLVPLQEAAAQPKSFQQVLFKILW